MNADSIMAGRLLSVALAAVLVHGCLLPQDDQVIEEIPPKKNSRPSIVAGREKPGQEATLDIGTNCRPDTFSALVEDLDLSDRIRSRWFVDPDPMFSGVSFTGNTLEASKKAIRDTPMVAPPQLFSIGSPLREFTTGKAPHRLVLVVADGEFEFGISSSPTASHTLPDGGTYIDPSYTASYTWFVTTTMSASCPQ